MKPVAVFVVAFVFWCLLVWPYGGAAGGWDMQSIVVGLAAALIAAVLFGGTLAERPALFLNPARWFWLICFIPVFAYYCIKANLEVVYLVLHPDMPIEPGIVKVHTSLRSKTGITALANCITLTPGTLTVDATEDGVLYVHWIKVKATEEDDVTREIPGHFERFLKRIIE